ncbi:zeta toxin family protein [Lonepinella sp. BR2882]|uniref:zeta toxin family protein n=1 Tax=Lonepinella sp. BR2882 TaxID=3095283 RepID=UPI003F6DC143
MEHNDLIKEINNYNLEKDLEDKFPLVWEKVKGDKELSRQDNPVGILLGGQPGAGKSFATLNITERFNNNVLIINGDEFRSYHKHYDDLYNVYGKDASKHTTLFSGGMVGKIRDEAIKQGFNIVIEGTFRTSATPLKEINNFKNNGYTSEVVICTCPKELSWESTLKRAEEQKQVGIQPRYVPKDIHDSAVSNLAKNAEEVFKSGLVKKLEVYSRERKLFDSQTENISNLAKTINNEINGKNKVYSISFNYNKDKNAYSINLNGKNATEVMNNDPNAFSALRSCKQLSNYSDEQIKSGVLPREQGQSRPVDMKINSSGKEITTTKQKESSLER